MISWIDSLILFNRKIEKINRGKFGKIKPQSTYIAVTFSLQNIPYRNAEGKFYWVGPTEEEIDAFVLNLRMLIRNGDGISIRELSNHYENNNIIKNYVSNETINNFFRLRNKFNEYLDGTIETNISGVYMIRKELLDIWLWGEFAHIGGRAGNYRNILNIWDLNHLNLFMLDKFVIILYDCLEFFNSFRNINLRTIREIMANLFWAINPKP